ncbi:MAG TPA: riboflavin synthase [Elusimicrobiales bacterium]|nr:riboflavin synthase [Elusimicrobiales bacterium]
MFTGIIEAVEKLKAVSRGRLETAVPAGWTLAAGESVAVNGACLTVISFSKGLAAFDLSPETSGRTALGTLKAGARVNLERAMKADGRFSGHFVTGHIDGTASLLGVKKTAGSFELTFGAPAAARLVEKGSVALNGVSLTVFEITGHTFKAAVIPHTWENTNLKDLKPGRSVNIEYDILGKYADRAAGSKITEQFLRDNGF